MNHTYKLKALLSYALKEKASDIHITYNQNNYSIELRTIEGYIKKIEFSMSKNFIQYIKIKAQIDLLSALKPQTGQFEFLVAQQVVSIRVAYLKNKQMESMVLRLLNQTHPYNINDLFTEHELVIINQILHHKAGLIIVSGTTGSGKTTTLYSFLDYLKTLKIYSIEDPIEIIKENVVQLQVNKLAHFGFDEAIVQILRHDPNVIVIGEIRSSEEAQAALRCSLSGHLVISTLHASNESIAIRRLVDLGCDKEVLYDSLLSIVHQSLHYNDQTKNREAHYTILQKQNIEQLMDRH